MTVSRWLAVVALALTAAWLALAWPRLADVETGRTPEYGDLKPRVYTVSESTVSKGAIKAVEALGWTYVGAGSGPGGSEVKAVAYSPLLRFPHDFTVKIRHLGGRTTVSIRSQSRYGKWDLGQNARNIRAYLDELDRQVK
jgi:hypothetical protein